MKYILSLFLALTVVGSGCVAKQDVWDWEELHEQIRLTTDAAIASNDFTRCEELDKKALSLADREVAANSNADPSTQYPRASCFMEYAKATLDTDACTALNEADSPEDTAVDCYTYLAEVKSDPLLCEKINATEFPQSSVICRALVLLDADICYEIPSDEHDTSKYSRHVAWCIRGVVRRTKNYELCNQINSADFGEQWETTRAHCADRSIIYGEDIPDRIEL